MLEPSMSEPTNGLYTMLKEIFLHLHLQTSDFLLPSCSYVNQAVEFAVWVNTPLNRRHSFYQVAEYEPKQLADIELKKIRCFSCILLCYIGPY